MLSNEIVLAISPKLKASPAPTGISEPHLLG